MKSAKSTFLWLLLGLALCVAPAAAQEKTAEERAAALRDSLQKRFGEKVEMRFDQPYAGTTNHFQMVDLFLPKQRVDDKPVPVVVFIHGGGWSGGDRTGYDTAAAQLAASGKYAAASVGYRLSGQAKWPQQIYDCKAAIRWIRGHAKELNIDPDKIGATGASAGGHLVTLLGVTGGVKELEGDLGENTAESSRVTCVVNVCGPTDLAAPLMEGDAAKKDDPAVSGLLGGKISDKLAEAKAASPLTYVTSQAVPIMTVHGTEDTRVNFNHAERLDAALKAAGATSLLIPMVKAGHGIPFGPELQARIQAFWDLYLRGEKSQISTAPIEPAPPKE